MTDKVLLCAIAKQENLYIKEWVDYHLNLGFDHITIYDNNDTGGERISDVVSGDMRVDVVDFRGKTQKSCETQVEAYNHCYRNAGNYTWVLFIDIDEFLWFKDYENVKTFLSQNWVRRANVIRFHWKCYSDGEQLRYEDRPVMERFTQPCENAEVNFHTKQMYRTNLGSLRIVNVHYSTNVSYIFYPDGKPAPYTTSTKDSSIHDEVAHIKHYVTKSLEEYVRVKWARRCDGSSKTRLSMDFYFKYNKRTDEKVRYYNQLMNELKGNKSNVFVPKHTSGGNVCPAELAVCPGAVNPSPKTSAITPKISPNSADVAKVDKEYPFGVSVCISAWKTAEYIEECLDSVAAQTWFRDNDNWEILLGIDGCEETLAKVKEIMHKYKNLKVMMMDKNVGTYVTCNTIMKEAKYEWLLRFDSDDVMYENMVESIMLSKNNSKLVTCYCHENKNMSGDTKWGEGQLFINHQAFDCFGGFQNWKCAADSEFIKRTQKHIGQLIIRTPLFYRRKRENRLTYSASTKFGSSYRLEKKKYIQEKAPYITNIQYTVTNFFTINDIACNAMNAQIETKELKGIISLTSWTARINTVYRTIETLLKNKGYKIVLCLSEKEFPKKENELPQSIMNFVNNGSLEILWVYENYKALKKFIFTIEKYKDLNVPIISADDDCLYKEGYADEMYAKWKEDERNVVRYNMYNVRDDWYYTQGPCTLYPPSTFKYMTDIAKRLKTGNLKVEKNDDGVITNVLKSNGFKIVHVHRGHKFCFTFHDEVCPINNNKANKDFKSCYID